VLSTRICRQIPIRIVIRSLLITSSCLALLLGTAQLFPVKSHAATEAILVAAGDIACDPGSTFFKGGQGDATHCQQKATSDLVLKHTPTRVAVLGDAQYENGALAKFQASYQPSWGRFKSITRPAIGNHEYAIPGADGYFDYFGSLAGPRDKGWYAYDLGTWRIYVLNSNCGMDGQPAEVSCAANSPQVTWLKADLQANPRKCVLAYWHHPRWGTGPHGGYPQVAPFWDALYAAHADVILNGHDHLYARLARQTPSGTSSTAGLRQLTVGTGGKNLGTLVTKPRNYQTSSSTFGVLKLRLHGASAKYPQGWYMASYKAINGYTDPFSTGCRI
jgi:acid phosphatase type 7